jgi:hypothetical protein
MACVPFAARHSSGGVGTGRRADGHEDEEEPDVVSLRGELG